jgi:hypothetical protein
MPNIPPDVLDCTIYLYASEEAANAGDRSGGSGFLVVVPLEDGHQAGTFYAVTNAHVVGDGFPCIRLNKRDGTHAPLALNDADWIRHPDGDDLAIAPIALSADFRYGAIPTDHFVDGLDPTQFAVGRDVYMVGRYINHEGKAANTPTARFGNIAQLPYERIRTPRGIEQDAFLVDIRALSGYSGSPVLIYQARPDLDTNPEKWVKSFQHRLLGIDFGHIPTLGVVVDDTMQSPVLPRLWAEQNSGVAGVIPAWRLSQMLFEDEDIVTRREEGERKWLADNTSSGSPVLPD